MENNVERLLKLIKNEINPWIVASKISYFITDSLREGKISLYEAYLLHWEEIKFMRMGYTQSAWNREVGISECLVILNQKLVAHIFGEQASAGKLKEWGLEAYKINNEKRDHYIMDRYSMFLDANDSTELLEELLHTRGRYEKLSFDEGPYHTEVFPYTYYSPEEILLGNKDKTKYNKELKGFIEDLIVELNMM